MKMSHCHCIQSQTQASLIWVRCGLGSRSTGRQPGVAMPHWDSSKQACYHSVKEFIELPRGQAQPRVCNAVAGFDTGEVMNTLLALPVAALIGVGSLVFTASDAEAQRRGIGAGGGYRGTAVGGGYRAGYRGAYRAGYRGAYRGAAYRGGYYGNRYYGGRALAAGVGLAAGAAYGSGYGYGYGSGYGYAAPAAYDYNTNGGYNDASYATTTYSGSAFCDPGTVSGYPQTVYYGTPASTYYGGSGYYGGSYYGRPVVRAGIRRAAYYNNRPVVGHYGRRW